MNANQLLRLLRPLLNRGGKQQRWIWILVLLLVGYRFLQPYLPSAPVPSGTEAVVSAFQSKQSDIVVQFTAEVIKTLPDDLKGSRHQKLLLKLSDSNHTVLLAHNIDLAPRVPVREGDSLLVQGEYEFSQKGGVVHWTHHDPAGRHEPGWIELHGKRYQ